MKFRILTVLTGVFFCASVMAVEYPALNDVRLLESPFKQAQDRNIEYVMAMQPDRLLAPYLEEAGLEPPRKIRQLGE